MKFKNDNSKINLIPVISQAGSPNNSSYSTREPAILEIVNDNVYFYSDIDRDSYLYLVKTIKEKEEELLIRQIRYSLSEPPIIHLHINSYGGWAHSGFASYDFIRTLKVPVYTYVDGVVASASSLLSLAGKKRYIYDNSFVLIHQISQTYWGSFTHEEIKDDAENMKNLMESLRKVYLQSTKIPENELDLLLKRDLYLPSTKCLEYGIVDEIIK